MLQEWRMSQVATSVTNDQDCIRVRIELICEVNARSLELIRILSPKLLHTVDDHNRNHKLVPFLDSREFFSDSCTVS